MISLLPILAAFQLITFGYFPIYQFSAGVTNNTFAFPMTNGLSTRYPAFLVSTQTQSMNLINATVSCTVTLESDPGTAFRYGGEGSWNTGSTPANFRFFFSTVPGYSNSGTGNTNYWFCRTQWVEMCSGTNAACSPTMTISAQFNPEGWSDAGGCNECPPSTTNNFWAAVASVREIGISLGGGSFYDNGIAVTSGSATFHLNSFDVTAPFSVAIVGGFAQGQYVIEQSQDLINWQATGNSFFRGKMILGQTWTNSGGTNLPPPP